MKKKHYLFSIFAFVLLGIFYFIYTKKTEIDVLNISTEKIISSKLLTDSFILNEDEANIIFKNKILEINGKIKAINYINNTKTIVLQSNYEEYNVICEMQKNLDINNTLINKTVTIKGVCKGFLHDVIILNCVLLNIENNE